MRLAEYPVYFFETYAVSDGAAPTRTREGELVPRIPVFVTGKITDMKAPVDVSAAWKRRCPAETRIEAASCPARRGAQQIVMHVRLHRDGATSAVHRQPIGDSGGIRFHE